MKIGVAIGNSVSRARRNPFRDFVHPTEAVDAVARGTGLERGFYRKAGMWQVWSVHATKPRFRNDALVACAFLF